MHVNPLDLATQAGLFRPYHRNMRGPATLALTRLLRRSSIQRMGRRLRPIPDRPVSENGVAGEIACNHPQAIVCVLSALQLHDLISPSPLDVLRAIPNKFSDPEIDYPPLRIVRFSGAALTDGIDEHKIDGATVRVTSFARNVVHCFELRNKIGLDVALEALKEPWRPKRLRMDDLRRYATLCHVANVMRPYMESPS